MTQTETARAATMRPNEAGPYDLVIRGGRVMDPETGFDAVADVGVKDGRIAAISEAPLEGAQTLDAAGQIVAPGFIDIHAHGQFPVAAWLQAFDGVTTALELESGVLPIGKFYDDVAREGRPINFGASSSWSFARIHAFLGDPPDASIGYFQRAFRETSWQKNLATPEQLEMILDEVESGLREGALGIGVNAGYAPGYGRKEYLALAQLAARHDVPTFTHVRYMSVVEPLSNFEAMEEVIALAAITGAHMHVCHINSTSSRDIAAAVDAVRAAQERGLPVTTEAYPYGAASTVIGAPFFKGPDWQARMGGAYDEELFMELNGKRLALAEVEAVQQSDPGAWIVFHFLDTEGEKIKAEDQALLDRSVLFPGAPIASDAMPWARADGSAVIEDVWPMPEDAFAHPRSTGTFSRFLSRYVRERREVSVMEGLAKCSLYGARVLERAVPQMRSKGRLQVGADADIVVLDIDAVKDNATFTEPARPSSGHRHVIVNGTPIIEDGARMGDRKPGRGIRRRV